MNALITGASSGIGYEFAWLFAQAGYDLVITARSSDKLDELKGQLEEKFQSKVLCLPMDLSKPQGAENLFEETQKRQLVIDVLVNNAGFGASGPVAEMELSNIHEMIELNVTCLTVLQKLYSQEMIKRKSGRILNVASVGGFQPGPWMALYFATKAFVLSLGEASAQELKGTGVTLTTLCPGPSPTGFGARAKMSTKKIKGADLLSLSPKDVAKAGFEAVHRGKVLSVPGFGNRMVVQLNRLLPRALTRKLIGDMQKKALNN